jgi:NadR type nicotinamide-nucleotide adenylyltransferase
MIRKIAVVGPESTGKSELCQHLAQNYNSEWVPEYARIHLDRLDRPYEREDLGLIAQGQMAWEDDKAEYANKYLFCDTTLLTIKIWSDHKYGSTDEWIEEELKRRKYDFYILGNIDLMWTPDPQREHPKLRKHFLDVFENYLKENNLPYAIVSGIEDIRTANASNAIDAFFGE